MTIPAGPRYTAAIKALREWGERTGRLAQIRADRAERERNGTDAVSFDAAELAATGDCARLTDSHGRVVASSAAVSTAVGEGE